MKSIHVPGFVDIHIHGGFGIDVMQASRPDLERLDDLLRERCGYRGWCPTTVTCPPEAALAVLEALPDRPSVIGLHLEGPFLSPKHPGAQPPQYLAEYPGPGSAWDAVLDHPKLRIVTLAPEIPGGLDLIRRLVARGVIVSLGHTDATFAQTEAAVVAGARHVTHLFNAMRPFHHREAGIIGHVLSRWDLDPEIIYDRLHVSPEAARVLFHPYNSTKGIAVSDGTMAIGLEPGTHLTMWGLECIVGEGDVRLLSNGGLAGSAITLLDAFRNFAADYDLDHAIRLCAVGPAQALGIRDGDLPGTLAFSSDLAKIQWSE